MLDIKSCILKGTKLQLEPLNNSHKNELYEIAQNESLWVYSPSKAFGHEFNRWFDKAITHLETGQHLPFAIRRLSDKKIIGSTRYYNIDSAHHKLAIGYTWYMQEVWGSYVNPECKFLLLKYAFETLYANRIEFVIDSRHSRSRAAIKKIGATEEDILRHHMVLQDGFIRDSIIFSIIQPEWPTIKSKLEMRLASSDCA
jgi:RimJ/RimL family protein N-acetyltransferase